MLIVAGSDSGGGAGIQADIKAVTALDGFAMTALSALTVQNTLGVRDVMPVPAPFVAAQMHAVLDDLGADVIKTGMLDRAEVIDVIAAICADRPGLPLVLDPVMVAKGGAPLLQASALEALRGRLLPHATLLTPNIPEAESLLGETIVDVAAMERAAVALRALGARAVLLKGGHMAGDALTDVLATQHGVRTFTDQRIATRHTHGTGCTLASAIATGLAQGLALEAAVIRGRRYLRAAIAEAPGYGGGAGPINHAVTVEAQWRV
ncbi:phosphomethylpyrimidine kinase [Ameyamaea chiangmaiensis NBRC 103196]|nr:phosphomethylpyrimidine kinase [Ameyamaea chiangmaiensis NBRC 103196]